MSNASPESLSLPEPLLAILREYDARTDDFNEAKLSFVLDRQQQECPAASELERKAIFAEIAALQLYLFPGQKKSRWGTRYSPALEGTRQDGKPCGNPDISRVDHAILQYWTERARTVKHPVLKGRYADVVWDLSKLAGVKPSILMLQQAVDSYVECGQRFPSSDDAEDRLERALELALSVADKQRIEPVVDTLLRLPGSTDRAEPYGIWLFDVLYDRKGVGLTDDQQKQLIDKLEKELQQTCEAANPFGIAARPHALRLARHYRQIGKPDDIKRVLQAYGNAVMALADNAHGLVAMSWLQDVYATYLEFGLKDEVAQVQIVAKQKGVEGEGQMICTEHSLTIPQEQIDAFIAGIVGENLESTLFRIAASLYPRLPDVRKQLEDAQTNTAIYAMIPLSKMGEGHVIANAGSIAGDPEGRLMFQMADNLKISSPFLQLAFDCTRQKYEFSAETLVPFLLRSPLFDPDRRQLLEYAVTAYLNDDHIAASHVLVPQIEHALRRLLGLLGKATDKHRRSDLTVMVEKTLNDILEKESVIRECLGEDVVMYLRVFLCDPRGLNVRNNVAHGLMKAEEFSRFISDRLLHIILLLAHIRGAERPPKKEDGASPP